MKSAWLPDETIAKFQSDFRFVADYFSQRRKNQRYKAPEGEPQHVRDIAKRQQSDVKKGWSMDEALDVLDVPQEYRALISSQI